jgi:hypothetical protein
MTAGPVNKKRTARIEFLVAATCIAFAVHQPFASASSDPEIKILHPTSNQSIADYPIPIEVEVRNFELLPPVQYWGKVQGEEMSRGHIHYTLDDSPIYATSRTKIVLSSPGKALPPGKHVLRAELVNANHANLKHEVFAEVTIYCKRAVPAGSQAQIKPVINHTVDLDLQQVKFQLQQVQQRLDEMKGH